MRLKVLPLLLAFLATTGGVALAAPQELEEAVRKIDNVVNRLHDQERLGQAQVMAYRSELAAVDRAIEGYECDGDVRSAGERIDRAMGAIRMEDNTMQARRLIREATDASRDAADMIRRSASWRYEGCRGGREGGAQPREGHRPWGDKGGQRGETFVAEYTVDGRSSFRGGIGHLTGQRGYGALVLDVSPAPGDKCPIVNTVKIQTNGRWSEHKVAARTNPGQNRYAHFSIPQGSTDLIISFDSARNARVRITLGD